MRSSIEAASAGVHATPLMAGRNEGGMTEGARLGNGGGTRERCREGRSGACEGKNRAGRRTGVREGYRWQAAVLMKES